MRNSRLSGFGLAVALSGLMAAPVLGQGPQAASPYKLTVFAKAPSGLSAPDSIAVLGDHVFVGYGDGHLPDGSDGLNSQVVEYRMDGSVVRTYTVPGHNDGLKVDPITSKLWALQNEDNFANLVIINPETHHQKLFTFGPTTHGGGYDDIVFRGCKVYISASNPANSPNTGAAIVSARLEGNTVEVEPVLFGNANAINLVDGTTNPLNLQDPDSMTLDPEGNLVLDSQADDELIIVGNPGRANQTVSLLPLQTLQGTPPALAPVEVDDTAFVASSQGFILFADKKLNAVYKLSKNAFSPGAAYTAADGAKLVGTIDVTTGVVTPVVTGLINPGGLVFVDTTKRDRDSERDGREACRDDDRERD
jgi:hypothetical protein